MAAAIINGNAELQCCISVDSVWSSALVLGHAITLGLQLQAHFRSVQRQCGYLRAAKKSRLEQRVPALWGAGLNRDAKPQVLW